MPRDRLTTLDILAHGVGLRLTSDGLVQPDPRFATLLGAYVPGARVVASQPTLHATVEHRESAIAGAVVSPDKVVLRDAWGGVVGEDAYHLLHAIARHRWLHFGLFSTHAACVETTPGQGVLLVGHSGTGKTTLLLDLLNEGGVAMFAGNKTLVEFDADGMAAVGGTATMTLPLVSPSVALLDDDRLVYGQRVAAHLRPGLRSRSARLRIRKVVLPRINDGVAERAVLSPLSALHTLHPFLLDRVNASVMLAGGAAIYPDPVREATQRELALALRRVLGDVPVVQAAGPRAFLINEVLSQ